MFVPCAILLAQAPIHRRFSLSPLPAYPYPKMHSSFPAHRSPISGATSNSATFFLWAAFPVSYSPSPQVCTDHTVSLTCVVRGWDTLLPSPLLFRDVTCRCPIRGPPFPLAFWGATRHHHPLHTLPKPPSLASTSSPPGTLSSPSTKMTTNLTSCNVGALIVEKRDSKGP
jgi:hypothetical protein